MANKKKDMVGKIVYAVVGTESFKNVMLKGRDMR